tara:strand:- start:5875 stop:6156 length:282 start_codon:yes stop_codon:yes gene_type:complete
LRNNVNKKLAEINKVLNGFNKSLKDKPLDTKKDHARALALIRSIRSVLQGAVSQEPHRKFYEAEPVVVTEEMIERNLKSIEEARQNLKKRRNR